VPALPPFATRVVVAAEIVRVLRKIEPDGTAAYRQTGRSRDAHRFARHDFTDATSWPGAPIPLDWSPIPEVLEPYFELEPAGSHLDRVYVRLRRLNQRIPEVGVVIGTATKLEGTVYDATEEGDDRALDGPGRRIALCEVALPPARTRSRVVLAHPQDLQPVPLTP
jgi:hypothetical protein